MVLEQKAEMIVMVTRLQENGREKVAQYWPDTIGTSHQYGHLAITLVDVNEERDWVLRSIKFQDQSGSTIEVKHLQFTSWPDHGIPDDPAIFEGFLRKMRPLRGACTVVHCSGGVGRAGCIIVADRQMDRFELQVRASTRTREKGQLGGASHLPLCSVFMSASVPAASRCAASAVSNCVTSFILVPASSGGGQK